MDREDLDMSRNAVIFKKYSTAQRANPLAHLGVNNLLANTPQAYTSRCVSGQWCWRWYGSAIFKTVEGDYKMFKLSRLSSCCIDKTQNVSQSCISGQWKASGVALTNRKHQCTEESFDDFSDEWESRKILVFITLRLALRRMEFGSKHQWTERYEKNS